MKHLKTFKQLNEGFLNKENVSGEIQEFFDDFFSNIENDFRIDKLKNLVIAQGATLEHAIFEYETSVGDVFKISKDSDRLVLRLPDNSNQSVIIGKKNANKLFNFFKKKYSDKKNKKSTDTYKVPSDLKNRYSRT